METKKIIVLIGKDAAGKTTLARAIADRCGKNYRVYWRDLLKKSWTPPADAAALIVDGAEADFFRAMSDGPGVRLVEGGPVMRKRTGVAQDIEDKIYPQIICTMNHSLPDDLDPAVLRRLDVTTLSRTF